MRAVHTAPIYDSVRPSIYPAILVTPITYHNTFHAIQRLKVSNSAGFDAITSKVLKYAPDPISEPLTDVMTRSVIESTFPACLKIAKTVAIPKKVRIYPLILYINI